MNDVMKKIEIKIPRLRSEQDDIANILIDLDKELNILKTKRNKINNLKNGLMQEILTAKTRLVKPEIANA
jgi:type I restriction enzyme S subunit